MKLPAPYAHQVRTVEGVKAAYRQGARSICVVIPTGGGKTLVGTMVGEGAMRKGRRMLWCAHREELVDQGAESLRRLGVECGIVKAGRASSPHAPIQVASVQTLHARPDSLPPADIIVLDECFVAGTPIDMSPGAKRIEDVRVGDLVTTDDGTKLPVVAVMRRPARALVRVSAAGLSVVCTPQHPFLTARGWVAAAELNTSDQVRTCHAEEYRNDLRGVLRPRDADRPEGPLRALPRAPREAGVLLDDVPGPARAQSVVRDDGANEPGVRVRADAEAQPDEGRRGSGEGLPVAPLDDAPSADARRQRAAASGRATDPRRGLGMANGSGRADASAARIGVPASLQARPSAPGDEDRHRGRRGESLRSEPAGAGQEEGAALGWARVDRVEVLEPGGDGTFGGVCPDRCVYNFEVAERHTYVAGGFVVHNCHHAVADTWRALIARYPSPELVLGLTATPERGDKQPLGRSSGGIFEALVAETSVAELQRTLRPDGSPILVPCSVVGPAAYQQGLFREPLEGLLEFGQRNGRLRPTVLFAGSTTEAAQIAERARQQGIRAAAVDGKTSPDVRRRAVKDFADGTLDLLTNVFVLTEGFDAPRAEVCAIARGCAADATFQQMVGRVLRSSPATGKRDALLIDYRGLSYVHGLIQHARAYSLDGKAITRTETPDIRQCPACGGVAEVAPRCPRCGATLSMPRPRRQRLERTEGQIITDARAPTEAAKRAVFERYVREGRAKGWKPTAAATRFKAIFNHWPKWTATSVT